MMRKLAIAALTLGLVGHAHAAPISCVVADPSGTPLNVRTGPMGSILGALNNDTVVLLSSMTVTNGKKWAKVIPVGAGKPGWVYFDYLADCQ
jgi:hypothetical protein